MATTLATFSRANNLGHEGSFERTSQEADAITLPTSSANAVLFDMRRFSVMAIDVDGAGGNTITFYGCTRTAYEAARASGAMPTVKALRDKTGAAITLDITSGSGIYEINPAIFGVPFVAPVINSGSVTATVILKQ